jgi:hypothetical protein
MVRCLAIMTGDKRREIGIHQVERCRRGATARKTGAGAAGGRLMATDDGSAQWRRATAACGRRLASGEQRVTSGVQQVASAALYTTRDSSARGTSRLVEKRLVEKWCERHTSNWHKRPGEKDKKGVVVIE